MLLTSNVPISDNVVINPMYLVLGIRSRRSVSAIQTAPPFPNVVIKRKTGVRTGFLTDS